MSQVDRLYADIRKKYSNNESVDWKEMKHRLTDLINKEIGQSFVGHQYRKLIQNG